MLRPPFEQCGITVFLIFDGPIELRGKIIDPTTRQPFARVSIEFCKRIVTLDLGGIARAPDTERTYAELNPRFGGLDRFIDPFDEGINIFAPPIVTTQSSSSAEPFPAGIIWKIQVRTRRIRFFVGIKVIIEMHAIDVITLHNIHHDAKRVILDIFLARIEPEKLAILTNHLRMGLADVIGGDRRLR